MHKVEAVGHGVLQHEDAGVHARQVVEGFDDVGAGQFLGGVVGVRGVRSRELAEPFVIGRGASSTMPQKRNPISSELMIAAAKLLRDKSSAMLDAMVQDFERATGPWHVEWAVIPETFFLHLPRPPERAYPVRIGVLSRWVHD
jgi:hypothetical protein